MPEMGQQQAAPGTSYLPPEVLEFIAQMTGIGYDSATAMEALNYQRQRDDANRQYEYWAATEAERGATERANIAAAASRAAASAGASAQKYAADREVEEATIAAQAARYAADKALQGLKISEANKLKIAAANLKLEAARVGSEEFGAPSAWVKQANYLREMGMTQQDITPQAISGLGEALGPVAPQFQFTPPAAPAAVVGDRGPELAVQHPGGTQVTPIGPQRRGWLRRQGVPEMARGGFMPAYRDETQREAWRGERDRWGGWGRGAWGQEPATPTVEPVEEPPPPPVEPAFLEMMRTGANVPLWQAWGGPRTIPGVVERPMKMPHEINYGDFVRLTPTEQEMQFAAWEALGMAPNTALGIMQRSAMRGSAQAVTAYG